MQDEIGDSRIIKAAFRSFPFHVGVGTDAVASVGSIVAIAAKKSAHKNSYMRMTSL